MRQFVVIAHQAPTTPDFSLDDLAGDGGRLDLLCRCVNAGLLLSHGIRDARVHLVLGEQTTVRFDGRTARGLHPDERSTAARIRDALAARPDAIGHQPATVAPGVDLYRMGLAETLEAVAEDAGGPVCRLHEEGTPIVEIDPPRAPAFILSDHRDLTADEEAALGDHVDYRLRLGPEAIHADHAIAVTHNWLDTAGFRTY